MRGSRLGRRVVALLVPIMAAACAQPLSSAAPEGACQAQIILTLEEALEGDPDETLVTDLERRARVDLAYLRAVAPNVFVFTLSDTSSDASCAAALARLSEDPRVRSAEIDVRRTRHST